MKRNICVLLCRVSQAHLAVVSPPRWPILRAYGGVHLAVMYLALAAALPGLHLEERADRRWPEADVEQALRIAGLWRPRPVAAIMPVLVLIVLVSPGSGVHLVCA